MEANGPSTVCYLFKTKMQRLFRTPGGGGGGGERYLNVRGARTLVKNAFAKNT